MEAEKERLLHFVFRSFRQETTLSLNRNLRLMTVELVKFQKRDVEDLVDFREKRFYLLKESSFMGERKGRWVSLTSQTHRLALGDSRMRGNDRVDEDEAGIFFISLASHIKF